MTYPYESQTWASAGFGTVVFSSVSWSWGQDEAAKSRFACAAPGCNHGASTGHVLRWLSREPRIGYCSDHVDRYVVWNEDEIPEEGFCLESLWPGARLDKRCMKPAGHDGLHEAEGRFQWGELERVEEIPE